jgi:hypothetical protein
MCRGEAAHVTFESGNKNGLKLRLYQLFFVTLEA